MKKRSIAQLIKTKDVVLKELKNLSHPPNVRKDLINMLRVLNKLDPTLVD
jgi:hypothetical protein